MEIYNMNMYMYPPYACDVSIWFSNVEWMHNSHNMIFVQT